MTRRWASGLLVVIALSGAMTVAGCCQAPPPAPVPPPPIPTITGLDTAMVGELVQLVGSPEGGSWVVLNHGNPQLDPPTPDLINVNAPGYYYPGPPPYYYWGDYWWPVDLGAPVNPGRAEINERGQFVAAAADVYIIGYQTLGGGIALHAITVTPTPVGPPTPTEIVITLPDGTLIVSGSTIVVGPTGLLLFLTGGTPPFTVVVSPPGVITATVIDGVILLLPGSCVPAGTYTVTIQIIGTTGFSITLTIQVQIIVPVPPVEETADAVVVISGKKGGEAR